MISASVDGTASLWDAQAGECQRLFRGHTDPILAAVFSADGHSVLTGAMDQTAILWDADTGEKKQVFKGHTDSLRAVALSPDGRRALTGAEDRTAILWDVGTGKAIFTLKGHPGKVRAVAFSPNGKLLATGAEADPQALGKVQEAKAILWDAATGQEVRELTGHQASVTSVAFSPDGSQLATGSGDQTAALWEVATGRRLRLLEGHKRVLTSVAFSSDGKQLVTGSQDRTAILWDVRSGNPLRTFEGHAGSVWSVALSGDGKRLLTGSADGTARVWDTAKGEEQIQLINMDGGKDWMAVTPTGLFDGSADGWQKVSYRLGEGMNVVPVDRFSQDFFKPGLLATVWGGKPPAPEVELGKSRAPLLRIVSPKEGGVVEATDLTLEVEATDQGSGVRGPWLMQNGVRISTSNPVQKQGKTVQRRFDVALIEGENRLEVEAASDDGSMASEPAVLVLRYEKPLPKPQLYLVAVGVSSYAQGAYKLKFARSDAEAMADLFRRRGEALYEKPLHIIEVLDDQATKEGIRKALADAAGQARPQDTLVLFLAGHGTMAGPRYYFIPHEFRSHPEKSRDDDVREQGLAAEVLGEFLTQGKALKRLLILDTCASGGAVDLFKASSRNPFGFRGEVERLSRSQGHFILAAAAATEEAKEPEKLHHGALSYALLAGMRAVKEGPLQGKGLEPSGGRVAGVLEWFTYAAGHVPRLTKEFCGEEQNVNLGSRGGSFPVLPVEER
jgi:WD40 repeat protein